MFIQVFFNYNYWFVKIEAGIIHYPDSTFCTFIFLHSSCFEFQFLQIFVSNNLCYRITHTEELSYRVYCFFHVLRIAGRNVSVKWFILGWQWSAIFVPNFTLLYRSFTTNYYGRSSLQNNENKKRFILGRKT